MQQINSSLGVWDKLSKLLNLIIKTDNSLQGILNYEFESFLFNQQAVRIEGIRKFCALTFKQSLI